MMTGGKEYIQMLVYLFTAFGSFILAILTAFFGGVGLYFGQAIVEGDVFTDYKYVCDDPTNTSSECESFNTSQQTDAYTDYQSFTDDINPLISRYIQATSVVFALLGLVFLFVALRSAGLVGGGSKKKNQDEFMQ